MNVLIVSLYYTPELGAAPSRITNMADGLKSKGANVDVLTALPNYPKGEIFEGYKRRLFKKEEINGINIFRYWTLASVSKSTIIRLLAMLSFACTLWLFSFRFKRIKSYDRVIIQSPPILISFSAVILFKCLYRKKVILNVSDLWPMSAVELGVVKTGSTYYKVLSWIERFIYRNTTAYQGQSSEIINHIKGFEADKKSFLYRNLQKDVTFSLPDTGNRESFKIVYAGLLGVAQDMLKLIKEIDFRKINVELHIYGGGNQTANIEEYIKSNPDCNVFFHGYLQKSDMVNKLSQYHASIVPLAVSIKGAVPSKIFDLMPVGVPILFCGGGEGANIINEYNIGYTSYPGDFKSLEDNILRLKNLSDDEYSVLKHNCLTASKTEFSFNQQLDKYYNFLSLL